MNLSSHFCSVWSLYILYQLLRWFGHSDQFHPQAVRMWSSAFQLLSDDTGRMLIAGVKGVSVYADKDNCGQT